MTSVSLTENHFLGDHNNDTFKHLHDYYDYYYEDFIVDSPSCSHPPCIFVVTLEVMIFILGSAGNGLVIWIAGFKLKKSVNTTWYLSLAVSDFLFCFFLPFDVIYRVRDDWIFGLFMCKFIPFIKFLNMFSSIFLLVIISVDRCVLVVFPVWAQNQRTIRKASVIVTLAWIISAGLSTPSLIFQVIHPHFTQTQVCYSNYTLQVYTAEVACRFVFGFLIPFLIIVICYSIILKVNQSVRFNKPFKIMTALTATFFVCWLLFHTHAFMEVDDRIYEGNTLIATHVLGITLASASSCVNPFIYAFMGRDVKIKWYMFLSKIENALVEQDENQNTQQFMPLTEENL